jgi:glycosyltransferase involved in cell wall biosynthesis
MKRPLKIGIEVQRLFRKKKHGMEIVALEILRELQQLDTYNQYVVFVRDGEDSECLKETPNFKIEVISASSYPTWEQFALPKAVKKHGLDFLHSTCNTSAIRLPVPLILTLHDIIYLEKVDFGGTTYQNFGNIYRRFVVPVVVKHSEYVITVSNFEKGVIKNRLNVPDEKLKVIYNAVNRRFNNNFTEQQITDFKKQYHLSEKFILFLGNTAPKKNAPNTIAAYIKYCREIASPMPMVILDYAPELLKETLASANASDLAANFVSPGFIPSTNMPQMYSAATLFLYPSLRESFGLPILEAMGCNTPVITSNTSCMPEIAGDAALLVDPFNIEEMASAIKNLLADEPQMQGLAAKGLKRAAEFSWKAAAENLLGIYEHFADKKS